VELTGARSGGLTSQDASGERQAAPVWLAQVGAKPFAHGVAIFEIPLFVLGYLARLLPRLRASLQAEIRSRFTIGQAGLASMKRGSSWPCQLESSD
jgi:hypothetical protein